MISNLNLRHKRFGESIHQIAYLTMVSDNRIHGYKEQCMKTTTSLNKESVNESRRDLLKGITTAAVVGGVVAAGISTQVSAAEKPQNNEQPKLKKGYHETQHIRDYFDSL